MTKKTRRTLLILAIEAVVLLVAHAVMIRGLAARGTVATLLSAGRHVPVSALLLAGAFVLVRLFAVLLLPGMIAYDLTRCGLRWLEQRRPSVSSAARSQEGSGTPRPPA